MRATNATLVASAPGAAVSQWKPRWTVDVGHGCKVGVTMDDGCFLVLVPDGTGQWWPGQWIPPAVARLIGSVSAEA